MLFKQPAEIIDIIKSELDRCLGDILAFMKQNISSFFPFSAG